MRALAAALVLVGIAAPASAGDRDFDAVVRSFERRFDAKRTRIPMWGFFRFVSNVAARPHGVKSMDVAIFEGLSLDASRLEDADAAVRDAVGKGWQPVVRVRERGESSCVYMRPDGNDVRMLVASLEPDETTIVQFRMNAKAFARMLDEEPRSVGRCGEAKRCTD